jgi:hypothetical protein
MSAQVPQIVTDMLLWLKALEGNLGQVFIATNGWVCFSNRKRDGEP